MSDDLQQPDGRLIPETWATSPPQMSRTYTQAEYDAARAAGFEAGQREMREKIRFRMASIARNCRVPANVEVLQLIESAVATEPIRALPVLPEAATESMGRRGV